MAETDSDNALLPRIGGGGGLPAPVLVDPLNAQNRGIQSAKGLWDIRGLQAQEAWGQILQQSTDANGNVDYGKAQAAAAKDPMATMGMMSALKDTSSLRGSQFNLNTAQNNSVNAAATAALAEPDDEKMKQTVYQQMMRQVQMGLIPLDRAMAALHNMSTDPAEMRRQLETIRVQTLPPDQQQQVIHGMPFRQTGPDGRTIGATQDPRGGAVSTPPQAGAPLGLTPESAAAHQQWLKTGKDYPDPADPTVTKHGTNETFLKDSGVPDQFIYVGGAPATPGTQPRAASPLGTGRPPAALLNPNKPAGAPAGSPPAPTPSPAGTGISGPTPAQKATATATAKQGELGPPEFQRHATEDTQAQSQQATLANMLNDTSQFTTGKLAGIVGGMRNWANSLGLPGVNVEAQSAKESFGKLAAGLANAQGAGSDARMNVNISANPHEELSPAGVDMILRQLQGNTDYIRARASLAAKYPDKANYPAFQESVKELDPRVFQLSRMTDEQRQTYWKNVNDKEKLGAAIKKAKGMGALGG